MTHKNNYDIIVIGAGCGGLSAAVCAAKEGKKVLLLERHNTPGGFSTSFVRGRFEFETSLHELCRFSTEAGLGELRQIFDFMGISDKIKWSPVPDAFRLLSKSYDGSPIDVTMPFGQDNFINTMEEYVPGSKESMTRLFMLGDEIEAAIEYFASNEIKISLKEIHNIMKKYGNFVKTAPYSVNEVLDALKVPQKAREIFNAYWWYLGIDCDRLSFTHYICMVNSYIRLGSVIPTYRSHEMSMALAGALEDYNGEIRYNSHVSRILFKDGEACGVVMKNGEKIDCNHIICNCSPTTVYSKMMKKSDVPLSAVKRTNARTFGARGACVYLGLNRSPEELGIKDYSFFITDTVDSASQFALMKTIDTNSSQATVCLNIANPDCSPEGTTIMCMTTLYTDNCWADVTPEGYFDEKDMLAARLIAKFEEATGITIHKYIEEIEVATPVTFARYTNTPQGCIYGYLGDDWDSVVPRFMTEALDCDTKGLRFCGGWGTQLSGINSAVASGRNAAYATLGDIENERSAQNEA